MNISVNNEGENPLYELTMSIHEIEDNFQGKLHRNVEEVYQYLQKDLTIRLGTLAPKQGKMFPVKWPYFEKVNRNYNITFNTRDGSFMQFSRAALVNGHWKTAIKVFREDPNKPLYEIVDQEYPRNENREIKWQ